MKQIITYKEVEEVVNNTYNSVKSITEGKNADYIPYLHEIPSDLFGIAVCMTNGHLIEVGDTSYKFGIESISKIFTALLAMEQWGSEKLIEMIGADATGMSFNSILAILLEAEHPSTPLVNAGAIAACSMIKPLGDPSTKWESIKHFIEAMVSSKVDLIDELYASESQTNFNNRSIAWLLRNYNRIYDNPEAALDLYTRQCSLGITTQQLSVAAATIAHSGNNPISGMQIFKPNLSPNIISLMSTVGFYETTGDWMFRTGLPAKSGVGGGVMGVAPGILGIAAFAPPLDKTGNSVKAQIALKKIAEELNINIFSAERASVRESNEIFADVF